MGKIGIPKFVKEYAFVSVAAYLVSLALYGRKSIIASYRALDKSSPKYIGMTVDATGEGSVPVGGAVAGVYWVLWRGHLGDVSCSP